MKPVHISVVLDRSGSMKSIASDIVGGFNQFLAKQREGVGEARLTLAQFDSEDPFEVLIDGVPLREVTDLDPASYQPRAITPLYDAVGRMIVRCESEIAARELSGLDEEDQVVLLITDGLENASREFNREQIFKLIEERREAGWVFVFLGADQDVYAVGEQYGVAPGNRAAWDKSAGGTEKMWKDAAYSTSSYRAKSSEIRQRDHDRFYEEAPEDASSEE